MGGAAPSPADAGLLQVLLKQNPHLPLQRRPNDSSVLGHVTVLLVAQDEQRAGLMLHYGVGEDAVQDPGTSNRVLYSEIYMFTRDFSSFDIMLLHLKLQTCFVLLGIKHSNVIKIVFNIAQ